MPNNTEEKKENKNKNTQMNCMTSLIPWTHCANKVKFNPSMGKLSSKVQDEITNPFPNFNGCTVEVWEWISNFIPHFITDVITSAYIFCWYSHDKYN